jgi:hypothetical protein
MSVVHISLSMIAILLIIIAIEVELRPRIGFTKEGKTILWYGKKNRKFIILF